MRRAEDRLFERFRRRGEPQALAGVFDRTAPELLRVAQYLVGDRAAAEDLMQETFVLAIERAQTFDRERHVLPWLLGILVNLARRHRRAARVRGGDVSARASDDPLEAAAGAELQANVRAAIAGLGEPYRQVLVLHLQHGLSAKEIAEALDRPAGTVRTQVMRGLQQLRKALPASLGAAAMAAESGGRGLAAVREVVVARAREGALTMTGAVGGGAIVTLFGVWTMHKAVSTIVVTAILALATVATVFAVEAFGTPVPEVERPEMLRGQASAESTAPKLPDANAVARVAVAEAPSTGDVAVRVVYADDTPAAGIVVFAGSPNDALVQQTTDDAGSVTFKSMPGGLLSLWTSLGQAESAWVKAGQITQLVVRVPAGVTVEGMVVDEHRAAVAGAVVLGCDQTLDEMTGVELARCDAQGRFVVRDLRSTHRLWALAPGYRPSAARYFSGPAGGRVEIRLELGPRGHGLTGRVIDEQRRAVPRAWVGVGIAATDSSMVGRRGYAWGEALDVHLVRADDAGGFSIDWAPAGVVRLIAQPAALLRPDRRAVREVVIEAGHECHAELQLTAQPSVRGTLRDSRGAPIAEASVFAFGEFEHRIATHPGDFTDSSTHTAADGTYRLEGLVPGSYRLGASVGQNRVEEKIEVQAGEERVLDLVLSLGVDATVRVLDEHGAPRVDWRVQWWRWHEVAGRQTLGQVESTYTGSDGRATARGFEPGSYTVTVYGPMHTPVRNYRDLCPLPSLTRELVDVPGAELELRVPDLDVPSAPLRGRVLGADGRPIAAELTLALPGWGYERLQFAVDPTSGRFEVERMIPGAFQLHVTANDSPGLSVPVSLVAGQTLDLGDLRLPAAARLDVRLVLDAGGKLTKPALLIGIGDYVAQDYSFPAGDDALRWRSRPLAAGTHRVFATADDMVPVRRDVTLAEGETRELEIPVVRGSRCDVEITFTEVGALDGIANGALDLRDARGATVFEQRLFGYFDDLPERLLRRTLSLAPGRYTLTVKDYDAQSRQAQSTFDVPATEPIRVRIE